MVQDSTFPSDLKLFLAVTHGMLSFSLLGHLAVALKSPDADKLTLQDVYDQFQSTHKSVLFGPFNEGVLLSALYLSVAVVKSNWDSFIPDDDLATWKITPLLIEAPCEPDPTRIKYVAKRLRNSLSHATPSIQVAAETVYENVATMVTITFSDKNIKNPADTFRLSLTFADAYHFAKKLHENIAFGLAMKHNLRLPLSVE